jgi:hypothetical protein
VNGERLLVVRREGALWGYPAALVEGVESSGGAAVRVRFADGGVLGADAVVAIAERLAVRRAPAAVTRRMAVPVRGFALWNEEAVLVADPGHRAPVATRGTR